jgi:serine/threonine protein kinase
VGDVVAGRYALLDPIARGASGSVWVVRDLRSGRLCAAKLMRRRDASDLMRFAREAEARFDHPHVVAPSAWTAEDDHVLLAMDLVPGGTVSGVLSRHGPLDRDSTALLLDQLLAALAAVHAAGWIHRDVKPANLLLEATGTGPARLRLGDFGIALRADHPRLTAVGMLNGTPGYQPPEIVGGGEPSPAQDLYAAGVVALACLARPAPRGDTPWAPAELDRLLRGAGLAAGDPLGLAVRRLLAVDPAERPESAQQARRLLGRRRDGAGAGPLRTADGTVVDLVDLVDHRDPTDRDRASVVVAGARAPAARAARLAGIVGAGLLVGLVLLRPWALPPGPGEACSDRGAVAVGAAEELLVCLDRDGDLRWSGPE